MTNLGKVNNITIVSILGLKFTTDSTSATVPENSPVDQSVANISFSLNGVNQSFVIIGGNVDGKFKLGLSTSVSLEILVAAAVDYETQNTYALTIQGNDSVSNDAIHVQITVVDANDNTPQFALTDYDISISEKAISEMSIFHFKAVDADYDGAGFVQYIINDTLTSPADKLKFTLATYTGIVTVSTGKLDYEGVETSIKLYVYPNDGVNSGNTAVLRITLIDANDNSPKFVKSLYDGVSIDENSAIGTAISNVSATDKDGASNKNIIYFILSNVHSDVFSVNSSTGLISVAGNIDRETTSSYTLTICATDNATDSKQLTPSDEQRIGCTIVKITVNDLNDNTPQFALTDYDISISEKAVSEMSIFHFKAVDADYDGGGFVQYMINTTLTSAADMSKFTLGQYTGIVTVSTGKLDYEAGQTISKLHVYPNDGVTSGDTAVLTITLIDVNDNSPKFVKSVYDGLSVNENSAIGTAISNVSATDKDGVSNKNIFYFILSNVHSDVFSVNSSTGLISVAGNIDRETTSSYTLTICATDNATDSKQLTPSDEQRIGCTIVKITVNDLNDNTPQFALTDYDISISEKAVSEMSIFHFKAVDADYDGGGFVQYMINTTLTSAADMSKFTLGQYTGIVTVSTGKLDYEAGQTISKLHVYPNDGVTSGDTAVLTITLIDVNDNSPTFVKSLYDGVSIDENSAIGTAISNVSATDKDGVSNKNIFYFILSNVHSDVFSVNSSTGLISVAGNIDRETTSSYTLTICATDNATDSKQLTPSDEQRIGCTIVKITVTDLNDNTPQFALTDYDISISEKAVSEMSIFHFKAVDADYDGGGFVQYMINTTLTSAADMSKFTLGQYTGIVTVSTGKLDYEAGQTISKLHVYPNDGVTSGDTAVLTITLIDVNDNSPKFVKSVYDGLSVNENSAIGTAISNVSATDKDGVSNKNIFYFILSNVHSDVFSVNSSTGLISVAGNIDRETTSSYTLTICATDNATDSKQLTPSDEQRIGCTIVKITVNDLNDNSPQFALTDYDISISEKAVSEMSIFHFKAVDADYDGGGFVQYMINTTLTSAADMSKFTLGQYTGIVTVSTGKLDYEAGQTISKLHVYPNDGVTSGDTAVLTITLIDVNDNSPKFVKSVYDGLSVNENSAIGTAISNVSATDKDGVSNKNIFYFILSNVHSDVFSVNSSTGLISVAGNIDRETTSSYTLTICATDNATDSKQLTPSDEQRIGCTIVKITVTDLNDNSPQFALTDYHISISEKAVSEMSIFHFKAVDADYDGGGFVQYMINTTLTSAADMSKFTLGQYTGIVTVSTGKLDYEAGQTSFKLYVYPNDLKNSGHTAVLTITLIDVNDNSPKFPQDVYSFFVNGTGVVGSYVGSVAANDSDGSSNNVLFYFNLGNQYTNVFSLNSSSGQINIIGSVILTSYALTICATDNAVDNKQLNPGYEKRTGCAIVHINVPAKNGTGIPRFSPSTFNIEISEKAPAGMIVFQLVAVDLDNTPVLYEFNTSRTSANDMSQFTLDSNTGILRLSSNKLDYEIKNSFVLHISSKDSVTLQYGDEATLTIAVLDVNDHNPTFSKPSYVFEVMENATNGYSIGTISASDLDGTLPNRNIAYSMLQNSYSSKFTINPSNGQLTVAGSLDYEAGVSLFLLTVCVSDNAVDQRQLNPG